MKASTQYIFDPRPVISAFINGTDKRFPVNRIYCVGRNYAEHAKEMGHSGSEPPFFFQKPTDALLAIRADEIGVLPYPSLTTNFHYEAELVVAISKGGKNIKPEDAEHHIYGYAVGLDMTRRDLQAEMKKKQWPWSIGKGFDFSAPMGPITVKEEAGDVGNAEIYL